MQYNPANKLCSKRFLIFASLLVVAGSVSLAQADSERAFWKLVVPGQVLTGLGAGKVFEANGDRRADGIYRHGVHLLLSSPDTDRGPKHERRARSYLDVCSTIWSGRGDCSVPRSHYKL